MEIKFEMVQVCSAALNQPGGLIDVYGITDTFRVPAIPCVANQFVLLVRFRLIGVRRDAGQLDLQIVDPDGAVVWEHKGRLDGQAEPHVASAVANMTITRKGQKFEKLGVHEVRVIWNGAEVVSTPLNIELAKAQ